MKNSWYKKGIVFGIIVLFIGVGIGPSIARDLSDNLSNNLSDNIDVNPKLYLFQTLIDIYNNPDVHDLFENYQDEWIMHLDFTQRFVTIDFLDESYRHGIELINANGEDKSGDMIKSFKSSNSEMLDGLSSIIMNDDELSNKVSKLEEMNRELKPVEPLSEPPVICGILESLFIFYVNMFEYFGDLYFKFMEAGMEELASICLSTAYFFLYSCEPIVFLMIVFGCELEY